MKTSRSTRALLLCCTIDALTVPALARAEDADQPQGAAQDALASTSEIIVTATRHAQSLKVLPILC